jgi:hypothetical protein
MSAPSIIEVGPSGSKDPHFNRLVILKSPFQLEIELSDVAGSAEGKHSVHE